MNHRDKHSTENEEALLPYAVVIILDKNLAEPFSDGMSRDRAFTEKQSSYHQKEKL